MIAKKHERETLQLEPPRPLSMNSPVHSARRPTPAFLAAALLLASGCGRAAPGAASVAPASDAAACGSPTWTEPRVIESLGTTVPRMPSISIAPDGTNGVVAGSDIQRYDDEPIPPRPLILLDLEGRRIEPPPGDFQFILPRVVAGPHPGEIHLAWAETTSEHLNRPRADWLVPNVTEIWYAHYRPGTGWTTPDKVYAGENDLRLGWAFTKEQSFLVDVDGTPHLMIAEFLYPQPGLFHYARHGGEWRRSVVSTHSSTAPNLVQVDSQLVTVYVSSVTNERAQDVMVTRSFDRGTTWEEPRQIFRYPSNSIPPIKLLAGQHGALHLVWMRFGSAEANDTIKTLASADRGLTWSAPEVVVAPYAPQWVDAAVDSCGTLHVTYQVMEMDEEKQIAWSHLWHVWDTGTSHGRQQLFSSLSVDDYVLTAGPFGLYLWVSMRPPERVDAAAPYHSALVQLRYGGA